MTINIIMVMMKINILSKFALTQIPVLPQMFVCFNYHPPILLLSCVLPPPTSGLIHIKVNQRRQDGVNSTPMMMMMMMMVVVVIVF